MKKIKYLLGCIIFLPVSALAGQWIDLWQTRDQQGMKLFRAGQTKLAAQLFQDKNWQSVSHYRAGNYSQAFKEFNHIKTSDGQYNAGNAAAYLGQYQEAITAYNKAIAFNPNNHDAITNREIIKRLLKQQQKQQQASQKPNNQPNKTSANETKNDKNDSVTKQQNSSTQQHSHNSASSNHQSNLQTKQNRPQKIFPQLHQSSNNQTNQQNQPNQVKQSLNQQREKYAAATASKKNQKERQNEYNKQLLRRLVDDSGGLLQQKFLRDYARRHGTLESGDQE